MNIQMKENKVKVVLYKMDLLEKIELMLGEGLSKEEKKKARKEEKGEKEDYEDVGHEQKESPEYEEAEHDTKNDEEE